MAGKGDKPEEIVAKLRQVEVLQGQGHSIADAVRQIGPPTDSAHTTNNTGEADVAWEMSL